MEDFKTNSARLEFYRAFANELHKAIKQDYDTIQNFASVKGMVRSNLVTTMTTRLYPYSLRLIEFLRVNKDIKYSDISTEIPAKLIEELRSAIEAHPDSVKENGTVRESIFWSKNTKWTNVWWTTVKKGIRVTPTTKLMELCDSLLEKEIFEYLVIKK